MQPKTLPIKSWFKKGLTAVLILTLLSSGFLFVSTASAKGWFDWRKINYWAFGIALMALLVSWLIEVIRIRLIAAGLNEKISFANVFSINLATAFTGNVTPFSSGGIPTQIFLLCRSGIQPGKASAIVTLRVIISTLLFTIFAPLLLIFYNAKFPFGVLHQIITIAIPLSCLLSIGLITFIIKPKLAQHFFTSLAKFFSFTKIGQKIQPLLEKFLTELEIFNQSIKQFRKGLHFYLVILCTILYWSIFFAIAPLLMYAFGFNAGEVFIESILFQFILVFILAYLPIPGGSGIMELGLFSVFIFIPLQVRAIFILAWRLVSYHLSTLIGGIVLMRLINHPPHPAAAAEFPD